jgi:hypothetical protein
MAVDVALVVRIASAAPAAVKQLAPDSQRSFLLAEGLAGAPAKSNRTRLTMANAC